MKYAKVSSINRLNTKPLLLRQQEIYMFPSYRQSHYKIYVAPHKQEEEKSRKLAYSDVRAAFQYYLKHYNNGRPIIIASHSQGVLCVECC